MQDNSNIVIDADNVTKEYRLFTNKSNKLVELIRLKNKRTIVNALYNVSFQLEKGECLGLVGLNGSGKSTLSNIIAGLVQPTYGSIAVKGDASCISVNVGLNPAMTGLENIEYKGYLMGFNRNEIIEMTPKVIEFADIGDYIYQPVKYYSSGMSARLGFAISINIDPDILVIDEGLSVGDQTFTDKCLSAMDVYRQKGKTIVFVSHSLQTVESFCTKAMWLEYGEMRIFGEVSEVCAEYKEFMSYFNNLGHDERIAYKRGKLESRG
jgi:teichoic acid transport system ATP-binding protein